MTVQNATAFIQLLRDSQLLEPGQLDELSRTPDATQVDAAMLAQGLVQMHWLTSYQTDQLLKGYGALLRMGPYIVLDFLGEGTTGATFKARRVDSKAILALKLLRQDRLTEAGVTARCRQDVEAATRLFHPYLARVDGITLQNDLYIYAREYVSGLSMAQLVRAVGPLPVVAACNFLRQAAQGLHRAHEKGIVHHHIHPGNLIAVPRAGASPANAIAESSQVAGADYLTDGTSLKVVDLGLAVLAGNTTLAGAPSPIDIRKDCLDLGSVFLTLLSGKPAENAGGVPAGIPAEVQTIVRRLLSTGDDAYRSLAEAAEALEPHSRFSSDVPVAVAVAAEAIPIAMAVSASTEVVQPVAPISVAAVPKAEAVPAASGLESTPAVPVPVSSAMPAPPVAEKPTPTVQEPATVRQIEPVSTADAVPMASAPTHPPPASGITPVEPSPLQTASPGSMMPAPALELEAPKLPEPTSPLPALELPSVENPSAPPTTATTSASLPVAPPVPDAIKAAGVPESIPEGVPAGITESSPQDAITFPIRPEAMPSSSPRLVKAGKKYGPFFYIGVVFGLLLHLVALAILIYVVFIRPNQTPSPGPKKRGEIPVGQPTSLVCQALDTDDGLAVWTARV